MAHSAMFLNLFLVPILISSKEILQRLNFNSVQIDVKQNQKG
jgi:hypothetical protein